MAFRPQLTFLHYAVHFENDYGKIVDAVKLIKAMKEHDETYFEMLETKYYPFGDRRLYGSTPLQLAANNADDKQTMEARERAMQCYNEMFHDASRFNQAMVNYKVSKKWNNKDLDYTYTFLHYAVEKNDVKLIKEIKARETNRHDSYRGMLETKYEGVTPLNYAASTCKYVLLWTDTEASTSTLVTPGVVSPVLHHLYEEEQPTDEQTMINAKDCYDAMFPDATKANQLKAAEALREAGYEL